MQHIAPRVHDGSFDTLWSRIARTIRDAQARRREREYADLLDGLRFTDSVERDLAQREYRRWS